MRPIWHAVNRPRERRVTRSMQPRTVLICTLLGAGCFHDPGSSLTDGTTTGTEGSDPESNNDSSDEESDGTDTDQTSSWTTTSGNTTDPETTTSTSTATSTGSDTSSDVCVPVDVEVDEAFEPGETRTLNLDFDDFPGSTDDDLELCITFTSTNAASARSIFIGGAEGQVLEFGPCNALGPPPGPFTICDPFVKPAGLTEVIIANTTPVPGCQNGSMADLTLQFLCPDGG